MKSKTSCPKDPVKILHAIAAFVHGASFVSMIAFWHHTNSQNYPKVYTTDVVWRQKLDPTASCTSVEDGCIIISSLSKGHEVNVYAIFFAFFFVSFGFEAYYTTLKFAGYRRWIEYAISASLQTFAIAVVCNVVNVFAALLSALMVGALQYFGYAMEKNNEKKPIAKTPKSSSELNKRAKLNFMAEVPESNLALSNEAQLKLMPTLSSSPPPNTTVSLELACGFLMLVFAWIPIFYHYFDNLSGPPWFVHVIFWLTFIAYCLFGVVMALRYNNFACLPKISKETAEISFTVLSLFSKLAVSWFYVGGTYMRDGKIESTT